MTLYVAKDCLKCIIFLSQLFRQWIVRLPPCPANLIFLAFKHFKNILLLLLFYECLPCMYILVYQETDTHRGQRSVWGFLKLE